MAQTIREPWILDYLVSTAEKYGGDLSVVPWREKAVKTQIIKVSISVHDIQYRACLVD